MRSDLQLLIATETEHRAQLYHRLLHQYTWQRSREGSLETAVTPYFLRKAVPRIGRLLFRVRKKTRKDFIWAEVDEASPSMTLEPDFGT
jgi:hypothetical protein